MDAEKYICVSQSQVREGGQGNYATEISMKLLHRHESSSLRSMNDCRAMLDLRRDERDVCLDG